MNIFLCLFLTFLEIGAVSFGGGYAMIPLIREKVLMNGWMEESEFVNIIAIAESTPGPIAVNMATYIGAEKGGILGSILATLGVVLPSFVIILLVATLIKRMLEYEVVKAFLCGVRPCVVALILGTSITLFMSQTLNVRGLISGKASPDVKGIIILALLFIISNVYKKIKGKKPSPILMIVISAVLGLILYGLF